VYGTKYENTSTSLSIFTLNVDKIIPHVNGKTRGLQ